MAAVAVEATATEVENSDMATARYAVITADALPVAAVGTRLPRRQRGGRVVEDEGLL